MMVITSRALKTSGYKLNSATVNQLTGFSDANKISAYAGNDVATLIKNNIVSGNGAQINPLGNTTRAEVAVMLYRIVNSK